MSISFGDTDFIFGNTPLLILLIALILILPVFIGVFVWRDSKKRGMSSPLWVLLSVTAPGFIGLIMYLTMRRELFLGSCSVCGEHFPAAYPRCPYCGAPTASNSTVETQLRAEKKSDRALKLLLALIVIVPLFVIALITAAHNKALESNHYTNRYNVIHTKESYLSTSNASDEIENWLNACDEAGGGFYLLSADSWSGSLRLKEYLVYCNIGGYSVEPSFTCGRLLQKTGEYFKFKEGETTCSDLLCYASVLYWDEDTPECFATLNGKRIKLSEPSGSFNPSILFRELASDVFCNDIYGNRSESSHLVLQQDFPTYYEDLRYSLYRRLGIASSSFSSDGGALTVTALSSPYADESYCHALSVILMSLVGDIQSIHWQCAEPCTFTRAEISKEYNGDPYAISESYFGFRSLFDRLDLYSLR